MDQSYNVICILLFCSEPARCSYYQFRVPRRRDPSSHELLIVDITQIPYFVSANTAQQQSENEDSETLPILSGLFKVT